MRKPPTTALRFFETLFNIATTEGAWKDHSHVEGTVHEYNGWQYAPKEQEKIKMQQEIKSFFASVFIVKTGKGSGSFLIHKSLAPNDW